MKMHIGFYPELKKGLHVKAECADIARQVHEASKLLPKPLKALTGDIQSE